MNAPSTFAKVLFQTGEWLRLRVLKNWNASKGSDGTPLKALSSDYLERKTGDGVSVNGAKRKGQGKPDFLLTGSMQRGLFVKRALNNVILTFRGGEIPKASGNASKRPNMMNVDKKLAGAVRDRFRVLVQKQILG